MAALMGSHYCREHQGNHSHYDPHNCELCMAHNKIRELQDELALVKAQLRVEGAVQEISVESVIGIKPDDYGIAPKVPPKYVDIGARVGKEDVAEDFIECPDCNTRWLKSNHDHCPLCWKEGRE